MSSFKQQLTELLLKKKLLTPSQLKEAINSQKKEGGKLSQILVNKGYVKQEELLAALSDILNIPPLDLSKIKLNPALFNKDIPPKMVEQYHFIPISKIGRTLTVATDDPLNIFVLDDLKIATNCELKTVITTSTQLSEAIKKYCQQSSEESLEEIAQDIEELKLELVKKKEEKVNLQELEKLAYETPIIRIINLLISEGVRNRASDLLVEPLEKETRVRYRIDGVLRESKRFPKAMHNALISRIKVLSNLDIAEMRLPQDGRFKAKVENQEVDFRVSVIPSGIGEKVALRILDKTTLTLDLDKLGFDPQNLRRLKDAVRRPHGMILICGPTGTGKTTTLYSILKYIDSPEKNIVTVEDPVEYQLPGINQVTYRQDIGLTFSRALRSILRQDPDVIMIGEIRDYETLDIAVKAALTGHLVLSTLHTTTASEAITRMLDMGIEPFLISSSVIGVGAQRLVRKVCERCREKYSTSEGVFYRGKGCPNCENTGYKGRVGIMEFLLLTPKIKELIANKGLEEEIRKEAIKSGMLSLREEGLKKAREGITTLEEVIRVTAE
ncbi:MAG: Flp pilus assembly complex ATPase component TadA [Candidatus Omnitrophica bacterium]|nr:Flp pilus assembly complex ATPase component TadA [Candidatus Omnitrophota bacterium]